MAMNPSISVLWNETVIIEPSKIERRKKGGGLRRKWTEDARTLVVRI